MSTNKITPVLDRVEQAEPAWSVEGRPVSISTKAQWRLLRLALILNDFVMIGLAFRVAFFVRFEMGLDIFQLEVVPSKAQYFRFLPALFPVWLAIAIASGLYSRPNLLGGIKEYSMAFRATTFTTLLVIIVGFLEPMIVVARGWLLGAWFFMFFFTASGRFWLRRLVYALRKRGYFMTPTLILGANSEGRSLAQQLTSWQTSGLRVVGLLDDRVETGTAIHGDLTVLGGIKHLRKLIDAYGIEELILAPSAYSRAELVAIFRVFGFSDTVNLRLASGLYEIVTTGLEVKEFAHVPLVRVNKVRMNGLESAVKFILDYTLAIGCLIALSPVMVALIVAIKLDSAGPAIYRRRAWGLNGRHFDAYKFRTMYTNGDAILDARPDLKAILEKEHKLKDDPRVTRTGKFIRKFSLDELPQLFNVLRGQMAVVGPRMIALDEITEYNYWSKNLLTVRPGITGLWQVSGRSDISYEERVRLDMHYIRNWNIWLDLHLLIRTIPAVLGRRGAY